MSFPPDDGKPATPSSNRGSTSAAEQNGRYLLRARVEVTTQEGAQALEIARAEGKAGVAALLEAAAAAGAGGACCPPGKSPPKYLHTVSRAEPRADLAAAPQHRKGTVFTVGSSRFHHPAHVCTAAE